MEAHQLGLAERTKINRFRSPDTMLKNAQNFDRFLREKGRLIIKGPKVKQITPDRVSHTFTIYAEGCKGTYQEVMNGGTIIEQTFDGTIPGYSYRLQSGIAENRRVILQYLTERKKRLDTHDHDIPFP